MVRALCEFNRDVAFSSDAHGAFVDVTFHLYFGRLIFYLIAEGAVSEMLAPLSPVAAVVHT